MPEAETLRFAATDFQPATFAERGAHVPFTSPMLAHARVRISTRGVREVVIRNPGGGEGWYVGQWHSLVDSARLSVHDRLLYRRIEAVEVLAPLGVRRIAREVALEGYAGRPAREAARAALAAEQEVARHAHLALVRAALAEAGHPDPAGALPADRPAEALAQAVPALLAALGGAEAAQHLARLSDLLGPAGTWPNAGPNAGPNPGPNPGPIPGPGGGPNAEPLAGVLAADLAVLQRFMDALDQTRNLQAGIDANLVAVVQRAGMAVLRGARLARDAALAGLDRPLAAAAGLAARDASLGRMAWLLDGWVALAAVWDAGEARGTAASHQALLEICANLPPLPREAALAFSGEAPAPPVATPPRRVRAGQGWLSGIAERDLVARNEALIARAM